jgi:hypothetical protein
LVGQRHASLTKLLRQGEFIAKHTIVNQQQPASEPLIDSCRRLHAGDRAVWFINVNT